MSGNSQGWNNPLVVAILSAAIAYAGNAYVLYLNANNQESSYKARAELERVADRERTEADREANRAKAEADRILEVIKTGDADKAAANLKFLVETGLLSKNDRIDSYIASRQTGQGAYLPPASVASTPQYTPKLTIKNVVCLFEPNTDVNQMYVSYSNTLRLKGYIIVPSKDRYTSEVIAVKGDIKKESITFFVNDDPEKPNIFVSLRREDGVVDEDIEIVKNLSLATGRKHKCADSFRYGARFDTTLNDVVGDN